MDNPEISTRTFVKVALASLVGTTIDFYDFIVAGLAATLAWGVVFFPETNAVNGLLLALAVYAVGLAARPLGNLFYAHFGDRLGRRAVLVWTLFTAGVGTLGIALVPTYAQIGVTAAVLLTIFRFVQSFGLGGEWGGASAWMIEFAGSGKSKYRGFWMSWVQLSIPLATALSASLFAFIIGYMGFHNFLLYGWRIPFYIGGIIIIIGIAIRLLTPESPLFLNAQKKKEIVKTPSLSIWKHESRNVIKLLLYFGFAAMLYFTVTVFSPAYQKSIGVSASVASLSVVVAGITGLIIVPLGGLLSDRFGRRKISYVTIIGSIIFTFPYFMLINTAQTADILIAQIVFIAIIQLQLSGNIALGAEYFATKFRYSGVGFQVTLGSVIGGGIATVVAPTLLSIYFKSAWIYISVILIVVTLVALGSLLTLRETSKEDLIE